MFQKIAKHRANDASNDVHRPPLKTPPQMGGKKWMIGEVAVGHLRDSGQVEGALGGTVLCV